MAVTCQVIELSSVLSYIYMYLLIHVHQDCDGKWWRIKKKTLKVLIFTEKCTLLTINPTLFPGSLTCIFHRAGRLETLVTVHSCVSHVCNCDDQLCLHILLCSSNIPVHVWYSYIHLQRIICSAKLCNKKYRSSYSVNWKQVFILLSSLAWEKSLTLCLCTRSYAHVNYAIIVHNRDAQCNNEESP